MKCLVLDVLAEQRTLIIGNSGSGKSTLAARIAAKSGCRHTGLDEIYWVNQRYLMKRGQAEAKQLAVAFSQESTWVIDGVFGWLVDVISPRATLLIWLDLPWSECEASLLQRGPVHGANEAEFNDLLAWAHLYWERKTSSSHMRHGQLFDGFTGRKLRMRARADVETWNDACVGQRKKI